MNIPKSLETFYKRELDKTEAFYLTDFEWEPKENLNRPPYYDYLHPGLIQFGFTARKALWLLFDGWSTKEPLVLYYEKGCESQIYAKNFEEFLMRIVIEEYSHTWLFEEEENLAYADRVFRSYPQLLEPVLGTQRAQLLETLLVNETLKLACNEDCPGYLTEAKKIAAIKKAVGFKYLDLNVELDTASDYYNGMLKPF